MKKHFYRAGSLMMLSLAFVASGCANTEGTFEDKVNENGQVVQPAAMTPPKVITGNTFTGMQEGIGFSNISKDVIKENLGLDVSNDLPCVIIKDRISDKGYSGLSCDWDAAWGKRPQAGQEQMPSTAPTARPVPAPTPAPGG